MKVSDYIRVGKCEERDCFRKKKESFPPCQSQKPWIGVKWTGAV